MIPFEEKMLSLLHPHSAFGTPLPLGEVMGVRGRSLSTKLEHLSSIALAKDEAIKANLPARRSKQREGGRGLGYGG